MIVATARHDRSVGVEAVEQQHNGESGEGLFNARGQSVKGLGFTILFALLVIAGLIFEKLAHQRDDHGAAWATGRSGFPQADDHDLSHTTLRECARCLPNCLVCDTSKQGQFGIPLGPAL